jgi:hypothetical protein
LSLGTRTRGMSGSSGQRDLSMDVAVRAGLIMWLIVRLRQAERLGRRVDLVRDAVEVDDLPTARELAEALRAVMMMADTTGAEPLAHACWIIKLVLTSICNARQQVIVETRLGDSLTDKSDSDKSALEYLALNWDAAYLGAIADELLRWRPRMGDVAEQLLPVYDRAGTVPQDTMKRVARLRTVLLADPDSVSGSVAGALLAHATWSVRAPLVQWRRCVAMMND